MHRCSYKFSGFSGQYSVHCTSFLLNVYVLFKLVNVLKNCSKNSEIRAAYFKKRNPEYEIFF